jgi:hypothetical protein
MSDPMDQPQALYDKDGGALPIDDVRMHLGDTDVQVMLDLLQQTDSGEDAADSG